MPIRFKAVSCLLGIKTPPCQKQAVRERGIGKSLDITKQKDRFSIIEETALLIVCCKLFHPGFDLIPPDAELNFPACKLKGIDAVGIVVVVRSRVGEKYLAKSI